MSGLRHGRLPDEDFRLRQLYAVTITPMLITLSAALFRRRRGCWLLMPRGYAFDGLSSSPPLITLDAALAFMLPMITPP